MASLAAMVEKIDFWDPLGFVVMLNVEVGPLHCLS